MPADFTIPDIMATVNTHRLPYRLADQSGRTWLITGATNGIGREAARAASQAGARVIITARNAERGEALRAELGNAAVLRVDFADLGSIAAGAAALAEPVDVLINNAGTISPARAETVDGHELLIGTNFLGPFAFTNLIMEHVRDRVVIVAAGLTGPTPSFDDAATGSPRPTLNRNSPTYCGDSSWSGGCVRATTRACPASTSSWPTPDGP